MRVLLLSSEIVPERAGGIAAYTATIAPALAARGHVVHVLSCAPEHADRDDYAEGVWWHRRHLIGGRRAPDNERYRQTLTRLATAATCRGQLSRLDTQFEIIESPEWMAESLLLSARRIPIVVNLHTPLHVLFRFDVRRFGRDLRIADALERASVRRAGLVTSASSALSERLLGDGWMRVAPEIVPLPVDLNEWAGSASAADAPPNILVVGRMEPRKAPEVALEASAILAADIPEVRVTFVGRSRGFREGMPYGEWLEKRAVELGAPARFEGQLPHPEMRTRYEQARVVAIPSHFESFSIAAAEGMASGRPVVYTSAVGAAEIIRGSSAGTEVKPGNPAAFAEALRPYLVDRAHAAKAGAAAKDLARTRLGLDTITEQRERCYEMAIARHGNCGT